LFLFIPRGRLERFRNFLFFPFFASSEHAALCTVLLTSKLTSRVLLLPLRAADSTFSASLSTSISAFCIVGDNAASALDLSERGCPSERIWRFPERDVAASLPSFLHLFSEQGPQSDAGAAPREGEGESEVSPSRGRRRRGSRSCVRVAKSRLFSVFSSGLEKRSERAGSAERSTVRTLHVEPRRGGLRTTLGGRRRHRGEKGVVEASGSADEREMQ
jgi:hypothetical protein